MSVRIYAFVWLNKGSIISIHWEVINVMVPTFPDWQNSLTRPIFLSIFQYFKKKFELKTWSILANNTQFIQILLKIIIIICSKFPDFYSIFVWFSDFSSLFKTP